MMKTYHPLVTDHWDPKLVLESIDEEPRSITGVLEDVLCDIERWIDAGKISRDELRYATLRALDLMAVSDDEPDFRWALAKNLDRGRDLIAEKWGR